MCFDLKIQKLEIDKITEVHDLYASISYDSKEYSTQIGFVKKGNYFIENIKNDDDNIEVEKTKNKLKKVTNQLKENDFYDVAIGYSDGPMAEKGGLMGSKIIDEIKKSGASVDAEIQTKTIDVLKKATGVLKNKKKSILFLFMQQILLYPS